MNRIFVFLMGIFMAFMAASSAQASFLRNDMDIVRGRVVAFDSENKKLTVESDSGDGQVVVDISSADITTSTNTGDRVIAIYKKEGAVATIVKPVPEGR